MGDILLTIPTLREMAKRNIEIHLVINARWQALADFLPARVHTFSGTGCLIKLAKELKALAPGSVFDLQGKLATIALRNLINAPITRVYQKRSLGEQLQALRRQYPLRFYDQRPVWQKYAEICGIEIDRPDASLNLSDSYLDECKELANKAGLNQNGYILIHPEASMPGKILPQELLASLQKHSPLQTALIGTKNSNLTTAPGHLDLRNQFNLHHLPGILKLAKAVISSDSGPMHLARAVNTPLAAIFLQTCPSLGFAPIPGDNVMVISKDMSCKPCSLHGQNESCPEDHFACRDLEPDSTASQVFKFLDSFI
jgi:heptosyltransferase-2